MATPDRGPRQRMLRRLVQLAAVVGLFVTGLAWLGASRAFGSRPELPVLLSAVLAFAQVAWVSRDRGDAEAFGSSVAGLLGAAALWVLTTTTTGASEGAFVLRWLVVGVAYAVTFVPVALLLHRRATFDARDASDRVLLAASVWLTASLAGATFAVRSARAAGAAYAGWTAPLLGPALLTLLALAGLTAVGAVLRGVRWLALWRRVRRGGAWRLVRASAWERAVPEVAWFALRGAELDGVVVRRVANEGGAYREAELEAAVARVPLDEKRVARVLAWRAAVAGALLVVLALLATGPLASLRW